MSALAAHFVRLANYNARANRILYDAVATLDDGDYRKPRKAFFGSIHGTLNHILLGDIIWMTRFEGGTYRSTNLDAELHSDFADLRAARSAMDDRISAFVEARVDEPFLGGTIRYVNNAGEQLEDPVSILLPHLFNHQTHHRGQVHDMLSQTSVAPPSLDMHRVLKPA
jgi:uncharacterized damage-inducible protein DinB